MCTIYNIYIRVKYIHVCSSMTCTTRLYCYYLVPSFFNDVFISGVGLAIPTIWRRICAEFIDFLLLFLIKFFITMMVIDYVDFVYVFNYSPAIDNYQNNVFTNE